MHRFESKRVEPGVIHAGGDAHWCGGKVLHLFGIEMVVPDVEGELDHIGYRAAGMSRHEVRQEILPALLSILECFEPIPEPVKDRVVRFVHNTGHLFCNVFRSYLEMPGYVVIGNLSEIIPTIGKSEIVADTRTDKDPLYSRDFPEFFQKNALFLVTGFETFARRIAVFVSSGTLRFPLPATKRVHICRGTSDILHNSFELRHIRHPGHFADDRVPAPTLDNPSLVVGKGTE